MQPSTFLFIECDAGPDLDKKFNYPVDGISTIRDDVTVDSETGNVDGRNFSTFLNFYNYSFEPITEPHSTTSITSGMNLTSDFSIRPTEVVKTVADSFNTNMSSSLWTRSRRLTFQQIEQASTAPKIHSGFINSNFNISTMFFITSTSSNIITMKNASNSGNPNAIADSTMYRKISMVSSTTMVNSTPMEENWTFDNILHFNSDSTYSSYLTVKDITVTSVDKEGISNANFQFIKAQCDVVRHSYTSTITAGYTSNTIVSNSKKNDVKLKVTKPDQSLINLKHKNGSTYLTLSFEHVKAVTGTVGQAAVAGHQSDLFTDSHQNLPNEPFSPQPSAPKTCICKITFVFILY